MKKSLFVGLALGAGLVCRCGAEDILGVECKQVAAGEYGDFVVQCPATQQILSLLNRNYPTALFLSTFVQEEWVDDAKNVYINVVPNDCGKDNYGYRVLIKEHLPMLDGKEPYAIAYCADEL